jgi:amidohydrolase
LRFGPDGSPAAAIRAELDALPIVEQTGVAWSSRNGAMHACGHDVHMAAVIAVALAVIDTAANVPLVVLLQPREEVYPCGAVDLLGSPRFAEAGIGAVIGAHLQPALAAGQVSVADGPVNASSDEFAIRLIGEGGHAAYPHRTRDPVVAASAVVGALQQLVSRRTDPMLPAVLTVGSIHGGASANAIPTEVILRGTLRSFSAEHRDQLDRELRDIAAHTAAGFGCQADTSVTRGEPVLYNDALLAAKMRPLVALHGYEVASDLRSCGADDFAYYSERVPSVMAFVGTGKGANDGAGLHHPQFLPPDGAVADVAFTLLAGFLAATEHLVTSGPVLTSSMGE